MRKNQEKRQSKTLLDILREEKTDKYQGGIYHKTQIDLTYNSNHMEGSRLNTIRQDIFLKPIPSVLKMKFLTWMT